MKEERLSGSANLHFESEEIEIAKVVNVFAKMPSLRDSYTKLSILKTIMPDVCSC